MSKYTNNSGLETSRNEPRAEILGGFLSDPSLLDEYRQQLVPEMFLEYRWLYNLILEVADSEGLTFRGVSSRCDLYQIQTLHQVKGSFFNERRLPDLITQIKKDNLSLVIKNIARQALDTPDPDEALRLLQQETYTLSSTESGTEKDFDQELDEWATEVMEIAEDPSKAYGMMTGLGELDRFTMGFQRTDFSVIGARTSMGKTAFVIELMLRLHKAGYKVAMYSLEMGRKQLFYRMIASLMQVDFEMFKSGKLAKTHYESAMKRKEELRGLVINDTRGVTADYISDDMRRLKRTQGLDFVIVDYIQDVHEPGETNDNSGSAISRVCRKLRKAAKVSDCHVMGLSQVVRDVEKRQDKRPLNSDLSGSTGIETSADVIALLYRDDYYNPDTDRKGILEVNFTKQRNGKTGKVELYYDRTTQKISSLSR